MTKRQNDEPRRDVQAERAEERSDQAECPDCETCAEYLNGWKRAQADYQNLQKQSEKEREDFRKYANESLLSDLIGVLDQFHLAMKFMPSMDDLPTEAQKNWKNWRVGVEAVKMKWDELASAHGLSEVPAEGAFDPMVHEAVEERESESAPAGEIIEVIQSGWKLHDKLLRPAKVIVAKSVSGANSENLTP